MSVSGLSPAHHKKAVNMTLQAAVLGFKHKEQVHYTEGPERWSGIDQDRKAWRGQVPTYADCSAYVTWCLWNGLDHFHYPDIVNGQKWRAGYTGTMMQHGVLVSSPLPGDAVIYGTAWPGEHTALYTGGGLVVSNGSEPGPFLLPIRYRPDILQIRRYL